MQTCHAIPGEPLPLGRRWEHNVTRIVFDISAWVAAFGAGTVRLLHQRQGDAAPYPVSITRTDADGTPDSATGTLVLWDATRTDTAKVCHYGRAELRYYSGTEGAEEFLAKSEIYRTVVADALGGATADAPPEQREWLDALLEAVDGIEDDISAAQSAREDAQSAASDAADDANTARAAAIAAQSARDDAEAARDAVENLTTATASADGLMSAADKSKLDGIPADATSNAGTITGITMNGVSKGTSGVVNLGTVLTEHQDISGKADASAVNALIGSDAGKSVRTIANEELTAQLIPENAQASLDTLHEIAAWIQSHPNDAAAINQKLTLGMNNGAEYPTVKDYVEAVTDGLIKLSALSAAVSGNGNAVTGASYDNSTGAFTFTKGLTFLTEHQDISGKVDKVTGKGLSTNDYTTAEKSKLSGIASGATANAAAAAAPLMDGSASVGASAKYAREDHRHATDTSRASAADVEAIKALLRNAVLYRTASGAPATFDDGAAANVRDLKVTITPTQEGSGDPSPTNVRPIIGVSSVTVTRSDAPSQIITITPTQSGSGDPSPTNVRSIAPGLSFARDDNSTLTVYGGTLDVTTGALSVTHKALDLGNYTWVKNNSPGHIYFAAQVSANPELRDLCPVPQNNGVVAEAMLFCSDYRVTTFASIYDMSVDNAIGMSSSGGIGVYDSSTLAYTAQEFKSYVSGKKVCVALATPVAYQLTPTETERALSALGYVGKVVTVSLTDGANPLTVYGGTLDVTTGTLTVNWKMFNVSDFTWAKISSYTTVNVFTTLPSGSMEKTPGDLNIMCEKYPTSTSVYDDPCISGSYSSNRLYFRAMPYATASDFMTNEADTQFVYELANPATYQLTPQQLPTLHGYNSVSANSGSVTVEYRADVALSLGGTA